MAAGKAFEARAIASVGVGRNDLCPCGSGKKYKHCCLGGEASSGGPPPDGAPAAPRRLSEVRQIARALFSAGQVLEAVAPFKEIVRLAPESADAHFDLGAVYARCGRFVDAAAAFARPSNCGRASTRRLRNSLTRSNTGSAIRNSLTPTAS